MDIRPGRQEQASTSEYMADLAARLAALALEYSQRMGELNKTHTQRMAEAQAAETRAKELEAKFSPYD